MQREDHVDRDEQRTPVLVPRQEITGTDRQWAKRYETGDVVTAAAARRSGSTLATTRALNASTQRTIRSRSGQMTIPCVGTTEACGRRVAQPSGAYEPHDPTSGILYRIMRDHFETFRAQAASLRDGDGLPRFVEQELRGFLRCGCLAAGFARFRCAACGQDRLVAFSCKGRGFCPRCGGRRMAERSAHLVDDVLPDVPVRQWVLSLPHRLRYLLAWDHALCRAVVGVAGASAAPTSAFERRLRRRRQPWPPS